MPDQLTHINEKIQQLKKKREKLQTQQAINFMKEIQKIFHEITGSSSKIEFSPEIALVVFANTWSTASDKQKKEWQMQATNFRYSAAPSSQKAHSSESKPVEN